MSDESWAFKQIHLRIGLGESRGSKHSYTEPILNLYYRQRRQTSRERGTIMAGAARYEKEA
eukprot:658991-Hanusia_phi.AAC.1